MFRKRKQFIGNKEEFRLIKTLGMAFIGLIKA